jgi:phenazine biosynthesis protein phzE
VRAALASRNAALAGFWLDPQQPQARHDPALAGLRVLVVDAEDGWTAMLAHVLRTLGLVVDRKPWSDAADTGGYDLVVAGPGPGDPRGLDVPKMAALRTIVTRALDAGQPLVGVCLGHQVLCGVLGLELVAKESPLQGTQREIELFGRRELVGFYCTFAARSGGWAPAGVEVATDTSGEVHAVRGARFAGVQFHAESILTTDGIGILRRLLTDLR